MSIELSLQMMGGWDRWEMVDFYQGVGGGTGRGYHFTDFVFSCASSFCSLKSSVPLSR